MKKLVLGKDSLAKIIKEASYVLRQGGVIVYPTETAYGLGADFLNPQAVKKVYQIKSRKSNKKLSVIVSDLKMAKGLVKFDEFSLSLARKYWPGPLTLILETKGKIKKIQPTLALRVSPAKIAQQIVKKLNQPLVATSANLAGQKECYQVTEIINQFKNKKHRPELVIDAGKLPKNKVSTIADLTKGKVKVLRQGEIQLNSNL